MARKPDSHHVLPLFCDDLIASCVDMSPMRFGAYMRILCYAWTRGGVPNDEQACSRIAGGLDHADSWHVLPRFPPDGPCYSYLFLAAELPSSRIYKVGVSQNVAQRFSQFCAGLPPVFTPRSVSMLLFDSKLLASLCEESILVHCRHLWIGGEWLLESREGYDGGACDVWK